MKASAGYAARIGSSVHVDVRTIVTETGGKGVLNQFISLDLGHKEGVCVPEIQEPPLEASKRRFR